MSNSETNNKNRNLYYVYFDIFDVNKPIGIVRTNSQQTKIIAGIIPRSNESYCKQLITDCTSSPLLHHYIDLILNQRDVSLEKKMVVNKRKGFRMNPETKQEIIQLLKNNVSIIYIKNKFGISKSRVYQLKQELI